MFFSSCIFKFLLLFHCIKFAFIKNWQFVSQLGKTRIPHVLKAEIQLQDSND